MSRRVPISPRKAFTLVELLVVMGIISILIGMMLPAVQAAREAARKVQCVNNIKQLALATQLHEDSQGHYPTGGWGWQWVGDPDRGFGRRQPGGWFYNILPYFENQAVHELGKGLSGDPKKAALARMAGIQIAGVNCPSRRRPGPYPHVRAPTVNASTISQDARSDYAMNAGDNLLGSNQGPDTYDDGDYQWPSEDGMTGLAHYASTITIQEVTDGLSNTYLISERFINKDDYESGQSPGDDFSMFQGFDHDIYRFTGKKDGDTIIPMPPASDAEPNNNLNVYAFGSAHPHIFNAALCDGSVRNISLAIDPETHRCLGNRCDQQTIDPESF